MNERISPVLERLHNKTIYSEKDFKSPQKILHRSLELGKLRDRDQDLFVRETTMLFSKFSRTKNASDIDPNELIATLFVLRDNPDQSKYRIRDLVKQEEISIIIDCLLGKKLEYLSYDKKSSIILPTYLILRSLKENDSYWALRYTRIDTNTKQTINLKDQLLTSIFTKDSKKTLENQFKKSLDISLPKKENFMYFLPLHLQPDDYKRQQAIDEMFGLAQESIKKPDNYEVRKSFFNLGSIFNDSDYENKSLILIDKAMPHIREQKTKKRLANSFRQTYVDILNNKNVLKIKLDVALNDELKKTGDFSQINTVIVKTLFENYQNKFDRAEKLEEFIKIPGIIQATEAMRKMYLLLKIKNILPRVKRQFIITPEYRSLLSIDEIQEKFSQKKIKDMFNSDNLEAFIDHNDDELITHITFLAIEDRIKKQEEIFNVRRFVKTAVNSYPLIKPDVLDPNKKIKQVHSGKIKIPIDTKFMVDEKDYAKILVYSQNNLLTTIPIYDIDYK